MTKKICFFNYYHNGDLLHSKAFVREVTEHLGQERVMYGHFLNKKVISDMDIAQVYIEGISPSDKVVHQEGSDIVFFNTWIGSYFDKYDGECTLRFNMKMWNDIYNHINQLFGTNLVLRDIECYLPYVEYDRFDIQNVKTFVANDDRKKVLFCNGPGHSNQSGYKGDMKEIVDTLSFLHPDKTFIITHDYDNDRKNVFYTGDIIKSNDNDLNEISYLSRYCDLIIGQNSGPFCFASTGENLNDPNKTFYAFGYRETDCFALGVPKKAEFIFEEYKDFNQLKRSIEQLVITI